MKLANTIAAVALTITPVAATADNITGRYFGISGGTYTLDPILSAAGNAVDVIQNASGEGGFFIGYDRLINDDLVMGVEASLSGRSYTIGGIGTGFSFCEDCEPFDYITDSSDFVRVKGKLGMPVGNVGVMYGIVGLSHEEYERTFTNVRTRQQWSNSSSNTGIVYGVGASMNVMERFRLSVEHLTDNYDGFETDSFQFGAAMRF